MATAHALAQLVKSGASLTDPNEISRVFRNVSFDGASGEVSFSTNLVRQNFQFVVNSWQGDGFVSVGRYFTILTLKSNGTKFFLTN